MPRGGRRAGAGRKPKSETVAAVAAVAAAEAWIAEAPESEATFEAVGPRDPLAYLLDVMQGVREASATQLRAAIAAAQYVHLKKGEGGKKDERGASAAQASLGRFAPAEGPPLKLVSR